MAIPLMLSAFTHLLNPIGFPCVHVDEGVYMRRAMHVLQGLGPQDPASRFDHGQSSTSSYDHPYFGQLFLAGVFTIIGYPHSLNPSSSSYGNALHSIEMLYMVPRILMGLLAIVDTFLVYKIAELRYNRTVALIAAVLFAVMPLSWLIRWILLDSILIPFLLSSILLASYTNTKGNRPSKNDRSKNNKDYKKNTFLILLSGVFLGLAIFTKTPIFTMIPLVGFLIFHNNNKHKMRTLGLWFIPVILIPLIWPAYAMYNGQLALWERALTSETYVHKYPINPTFLDSLNTDFRIDPVLIILGICGLAYAAVKRDVFILMFFVPYLISIATIAYFVTPFHLSPLLPGFCIASSNLIVNLSNRLWKKKVQQTITQYFGSSDAAETKVSNFVRNHFKKAARLFLHRLPFCVIFVIGIFGMISTTILITTNVNSAFFNAYAIIVHHLPDHLANDSNTYNKVTLIGPHWIWKYYWIPKYVFNRDHNYIFLVRGSYFKDPLKTEKVIFIIDDVGPLISRENAKYFNKQVLHLYNNTKIIAAFDNGNSRYNTGRYPFTSMTISSGIGRIEIKSNY